MSNQGFSTVKTASTLFIFFLCYSNSISQNLIPNGSFEINRNCPREISSPGERLTARPWYTPTLATPDIFHICSGGMNAVPKNFIGFSYPKDGEGYAGICVLKTDELYREYLAIPLSKPLAESAEYNLKFYYKIAHLSRVSIDSLQVIISPDSLTSTTNKILARTKSKPSLTVHVPLKNDSSVWREFSVRLKARGGERFFYIGNFSPSMAGKKRERDIHIKYGVDEGSEEMASYYYVDAFEMLEINPAPKQAFEIEKPFSMPDLYFDFNSFSVKEISRAGLEKLAGFLSGNPDLRLLIQGHADKKGNAKYNEELSLKRSKAVSEELKKYGVEASRIQTSGFGSRFPKAESDSLNRRVEFLITKSSK